MRKRKSLQYCLAKSVPFHDDLNLNSLSDFIVSRGDFKQHQKFLFMTTCISFVNMELPIKANTKFIAGERIFFVNLGKLSLIANILSDEMRDYTLKSFIESKKEKKTFISIL